MTSSHGAVITNISNPVKSLAYIRIPVSSGVVFYNKIDTSIPAVNAQEVILGYVMNLAWIQIDFVDVMS